GGLGAHAVREVPLAWPLVPGRDGAPPLCIGCVLVPSPAGRLILCADRSRRGEPAARPQSVLVIPRANCGRPTGSPRRPAAQGRGKLRMGRNPWPGACVPSPGDARALRRVGPEPAGPTSMLQL